MLYDTIRNTIIKNDKLFIALRFIYTPIRKTKEHYARRRMAEEILEKYKNVNSKNEKILYFGIPEHNNMGDIAQTFCTLNWIKKNYPDRILIPVRTRATFDKKFLKFMENTHNGNDIIVFQSGYCTRHKNPDHLMHLNIAKSFPDYRMVIMPQTVKLDNKKDIEATKTIFDKAKRLTFIARDKISYGYAEQFVQRNKLECYPDIVTSLIGRMQVPNKRNGVLMCLRNDGEKYYSKRDLDELKHRFEERCISVDIADTNNDKNAEDVFENLEDEVKKTISTFGRYECVVTDRYHGTIFSLIANTPVIVIKTNDHKVISAIEWFNGIYSEYSIQVAQTLQEAYVGAMYIIENSIEIKNPDTLYKNYYETSLKNVFDNDR